MKQMLMYLFYGAVYGFSACTPLSVSAHKALFPMLFRFDTARPLLSLFVHLGTLAAVVLLYRQRLSHLYEQMRVGTRPPRRRRLPTDTRAVLEGKMLRMAAIPALLGGFLSPLAAKLSPSLLVLAVLLIGSGVAVYLPDYLPGGDRTVNALSPLDALALGLCAACGVIGGLSAVELTLLFASVRKCERGYLLDIGILLVGVMLCAMILTDLVRVALAGFGGSSAGYLLGCLLAAAAAFGTAVGAILTVRFLAVKTGFSAFAFYQWGLGIFCFILYLMV